MAQAGVRYFSLAPNWFDRIGSIMVTWQDKPFWWVSPSGDQKILVWIPWTGYALSHVIRNSPIFAFNTITRAMPRSVTTGDVSTAGRRLYVA